MWNKRNHILHIIKSKKGFTLLEMMVSFTLLLILMTVTVTTIMPAVRTFQRVSQISTTQSVSSLLVDKISGELSTAKGDIKVDGNAIEYADQKGNKVRMYVDEKGKLILKYQEGTEWYFTDNVYAGCKIAVNGLKFDLVKMKSGTNAGNDAEKLVKITLKMTYGNGDREYERELVVDCYNSSNAVAKKSI